MSFIAVCFLLALQEGSPPAAMTPDSYLLRVKGAPGDTYTYSTHIFMSDESAKNTFELEGKIEDRFVRQYEDQIDWIQTMTLKKLTGKGKL